MIYQLRIKGIFTVCLFFIFLLYSCAPSYNIEKITDDAMEKWTSTVPVDSLPITKNLMDIFADNDLDSLVIEALQNNQNLRATALRLEAADYLLAHTRSNLLPSLSAGFSKGRNNQFVNPFTDKNITQNYNNLSLNLSWEIDLWGKLSQHHSASVLSWEAHKQDYLNLKDALAARVVQSWINLTASEKEVELRKEKMNLVSKSNESVIQKFKKGLVDLDAYNQSNTEFMICRSKLKSAEETHSKRIREMEVLLGRKPRTKFSAGKNFPVIKTLPVVIPAEVLKKRPDIRAGVARLNAAYKVSTAAKKEFLPSLSLSADMFKESVKLGDLTGSTLVWNILGRLTQSIFQGGRIISEAKARGLEAEAALADLKQIILNALHEVEDALGNERDLETAQTAFEKSFSNLEKSRIFYREKYKKGLTSFSILLEAEKQRVETKIRLNEVIAARLNNRIGLVLALGYGLNQNGEL